jgi:hypothetical protein
VEEEGRDVTMRGTRPIAVLLIVTGATSSAFVPLRALADDDADKNKAIATDLFDKGVAKMSEGHCDEEKPTKPGVCRDAREAFRRAYELYPAALGALRNLAYVEKGLGLVASASRSFRELARKAPLDPKPERQKWADFAREEVKGLEPRIPHLTVKVPTDRPAGMKITLDGLALQEAAWDTPIDVDPGEHSVHAEAPGRLSFDGSVTLAETQNKTLPVALDVDTRGSDASSKGNRTLPLVVASIGFVGVAAGLGLGYASMKKKDDACGGTKVCDPDGLSQGKSLANASTVVTGISAAVLVGGLVWFFVTPSGSEKGDKSAAVAPYVGPDGGGLAAVGRF